MQKTAPNTGFGSPRIAVFGLVAVVILGIGFGGAYAQSEAIPGWIKNIAGLWSQDKITDSEFVSAIEFLIEQNIIQVGENTEGPDNSAGPKRPSNISSIQNFIVTGSPDEDKYRLRFTLSDAGFAQIREAGHVSLKILDSQQNTLYSESFAVHKSDFGTYHLVLTGEEFLAYVWEIPTHKVKKGVGAYGSAKIVFTDGGGNKFSSENSVFVSEYTDEELAATHEKKFAKTADPINLQLEMDGLQVDLKRGGIYEFFEWSDKKSGFRADFVIENISNEPVSLSTYNSFIQTMDGRQYEDSSFSGTLESGTVLPGSVIGGYMLFEMNQDPADVKSLTLDTEYVFDLVNNRTYTLEQLREETYEKNAVEVGRDIEAGSFKITLTKVGSYEFSTWGNTKSGFRADFVVENIGTEPEHIPSRSNIILLDGRGNQYEQSYGGTLEYKKIHPGVTEAGYVIFEDYAGDTPEITIIATKSSYPEDYVWTWVVDLSR